jgi:hypothetical protein
MSRLTKGNLGLSISLRSRFRTSSQKFKSQLSEAKKEEGLTLFSLMG